MSYEVGVLCQAPEQMSPAAALSWLLEQLPGPAEQHELSTWETAASCWQKMASDGREFGVAVNMANPTVFDFAQQAWAEGVAPSPELYNAVVIFTLIDDVWEPVDLLLRLVIDQWNGLLFDEVSGFRATLN